MLWRQYQFLKNLDLLRCRFFQREAELSFCSFGRAPPRTTHVASTAHRPERDWERYTVRRAHAHPFLPSNELSYEFTAPYASACIKWRGALDRQNKSSFLFFLFFFFFFFSCTRRTVGFHSSQTHARIGKDTFGTQLLLEDPVGRSLLEKKNKYYSYTSGTTY